MPPQPGLQSVADGHCVASFFVPCKQSGIFDDPEPDRGPLHQPPKSRTDTCRSSLAPPLETLPHRQEGGQQHCLPAKRQWLTHSRRAHRPPQRRHKCDRDGRRPPRSPPHHHQYQ